MPNNLPYRKVHVPWRPCQQLVQVHVPVVVRLYDREDPRVFKDVVEIVTRTFN
jgi:hypothetical protein